ncbi:MAG: trypsin-like peptidase domain-containing protein [Clostridia bacterium]|nr:trypsin-like peptidase domain-containing protein [Clostridia bacterium]
MFDEKDNVNSSNSEVGENELPPIEEKAEVYEEAVTAWETADVPKSESTKIPEMPKKEKKKGGTLKKVCVTALCACVAGFVFGVTWMGVNYIFDKLSEGKAVQIQSTQDALNNTAEAITLNYSDTTEAVANGTIENIVDACLPSVVSITNKGVSEVITFFGNYQTESISSGSGIIIGENETELLIVTNYHVVADSKELTVVFSHDEAAVQGGDTSIMNVANVKGYDADKDIAVIAVKLSEITDETRAKIRIATIGNSDNVKLGSGVVAIGNALGYGQSVTHGIVSAVDREVTMQGVDGGMITNEYIQTDAAINSGNSGGALLNMRGELIGINSAKISSTGVEGMGYAIPITDVEELISELMSLKTREVVDEENRGYLGIYGTDVTSTAAQAYGMPVGIFVQETIANSPAAKSSLKAGDIITKIDGISVSSMAALQDRLSYYEKGETIVLTVKRLADNKYVEKEIEIKLGSKKDAGIED